jgi:hypothetical protein
VEARGRSFTLSSCCVTPSSYRNMGRPTMHGNCARGKLSPANPHLTNCTTAARTGTVSEPPQCLQRSAAWTLTSTARSMP